MARRPQGWRIRKPTGAESYSVVWWDSATRRTIERGTGERDPVRAAARAAQVYSEEIRGERKPGRRRTCLAPLSTKGVGALWLKDSLGLLDDKTLAVYSMYVETHLAPAFPSLLDVSPATVRTYQVGRLAKVQAQTVKHELSCLRCLCRWAHERGLLVDEPVIPSLPKRALGTKHDKRRRVAPVALDPEEIEAFLAKLPDQTEKLGQVKARFVLQYEMGLRPATLDRLSVPEHWKRGSAWLMLTPASMKARKSRRKPLTKRALEVLEAVAPNSGLIFGKHDYRDHVAAAATVLKDKAKAFTAAHLRSAAITHFIDRGASLTAAKEFADHERATTTDRYTKSSEQTLLAELAKQGKL